MKLRCWRAEGVTRHSGRVMDLSPFKDLIKKRCGLCFEDIRSAALEEGVRRRMSECRMDSVPAYLERLSENGGEFDHLVTLLTINETYFFREPVYFDLLAMRLLPELLSRKQGDAIRILSAGCSTGEEPYSIVMKLMDKYGAGMQKFISVSGFDIDNCALSAAKKGVYGGHSFRSVSGELIERYFIKIGNGLYRIRDAVRDSVGFTVLNFLSESYPADLSGVDVIFYRNVSIYFEPETRKDIFRKLAGLLNEGGYLVVSATETLSHDIGVLSLVEMDGIFMYRKNAGAGIRDVGKACPHGGAARLGKFPASPGITVPPVRHYRKDKAEGSARKDDNLLFEKALDHARAKKYDDSLGCLDILIEQAPAFVRAYTLKGSVLINMKRLDEAEKACLRSTELDQLCLEGYLLLGLVARMKNDDKTAIRRFKEALYLQASCWLAHFYLAEIYRTREEFSAACREYDIVVKLLRKGQQQDYGLVFFPLAFSAEQIAHLCVHNLDMLKKMETGARGV